MLVKIGSSRDDSDVVDLLLQCHTRIREFLALAVRLANERNASGDDVRDAAARVTRYFSEALPLHVADEEQSIMPRLSGRATDIDTSLNRMLREHQDHEAALEPLLETCRILQASPDRIGELQPRLASTAEAVERDFLVHLREEEDVILPAIRTVLTDEERAAILGELRARRR